MAKKRWLPTLLTYMALELGAMLGVPVRLDQIEEMTRWLNQTNAICLVREDPSGDPPDPGGDDTFEAPQ